MQHLYKIATFFPDDTEKAIYNACRAGHLPIVEYLHSLGTDILWGAITAAAKDIWILSAISALILLISQTIRFRVQHEEDI